MLVLLLACVSGQVSIGGPDPVGPDPREDTDPVPPVDEPVTETIGAAPGDTGPDEPEDVPDVLYSDDAITPLTLLLDDDAVWDLRRDPSDYVPATLVYGDRTWAIAVRIKGSSTFSSLDEKPSLVIDVDRLVPDQEFMGHKKFNLHNQLIDPSMMSEVRSYRTLRAAGLPASRAGYVRLTINDEDYGLYTSVEPINDDFLEAWFVDPAGNLYENGGEDCDFTNARCFEIEENDEGTDDAFDALVADALVEGDAWEPGMRARLDWTLFIRSIAMDALIAHWDGYAYDRSNYHVYHDPTADNWTFIPQSMDLDYGWRPWSYDTCGRHGVDPGDYTEGVLAEKCLASATCRAEFVAELLALNDAWEASDPVGQVDTLTALISADVESDDHKSYSYPAFERHVACVRAWVAQRPDEIRAWAAGE
ncbi:MAG: CotH kinase family protein [Pseudomonadota bacterium]|nr:CotH kinase family protein [Pseudomonadota bacterium]